MGTYRECRASCLRGISIADQFDEQVEAVRAAADGGDFAAYIPAQGSASVPRDNQSVRVARKTADEQNAYGEDVQKVFGIFSPRHGLNHVFETRTTEWCIVRKSPAVDLNLLTLKSASGAPRSPVNNCGKLTGGDIPDITPILSEHATAVLNLIELEVIGWNEPDVVKVLNGALKAGAPRKQWQQRSNAPLKACERASSARMTRLERDRVAKIRFDLAQEGITPEWWELDALARGATVVYGNKSLASRLLRSGMKSS